MSCRRIILLEWHSPASYSLSYRFLLSVRADSVENRVVNVFHYPVGEHYKPNYFAAVFDGPLSVLVRDASPMADAQPCAADLPALVLLQMVVV